MRVTFFDEKPIKPGEPGYKETFQVFAGHSPLSLLLTVIFFAVLYGSLNYFRS